MVRLRHCPSGFARAQPHCVRAEANFSPWAIAVVCIRASTPRRFARALFEPGAGAARPSAARRRRRVVLERPVDGLREAASAAGRAARDSDGRRDLARALPMLRRYGIATPHVAKRPQPRPQDASAGAQHEHEQQEPPADAVVDARREGRRRRARAMLKPPLDAVQAVRAAALGEQAGELASHAAQAAAAAAARPARSSAPGCPRAAPPRRGPAAQSCGASPPRPRWPPRPTRPRTPAANRLRAARARPAPRPRPRPRAVQRCAPIAGSDRRRCWHAPSASRPSHPRPLACRSVRRRPIARRRQTPPASTRARTPGPALLQFNPAFPPARRLNFSHWNNET